ncbi:MAG TPA: DUF2007-related protein [Daejeonella sp.]|nr:DUF2007-related protein [Daejeonella sp.]
MPQDEHNINPVEIFSGTSWEAGMVKSLLENSGIEAFVINDTAGSIWPLQTVTDDLAVKVMVAEKDFVEAQKIVEGYEKNMPDTAP